MKITITMLKEKFACQEQIELFDSLFGCEVEVTRESCRAVASRFDWEWGAKNILSAPARAEYERICAPARAKYVRISDPARAEYVRISNQAWAEKERISAQAKAEYERICAQAWADAYNRST